MMRIMASESFSNIAVAGAFLCLVEAIYQQRRRTLERIQLKCQKVMVESVWMLKNG